MPKLERRGTISGTYGAAAPVEKTEETPPKEAGPEQSETRQLEDHVEDKSIADDSKRVAGQIPREVTDNRKAEVKQTEWARSAVSESVRHARRRPKEWGTMPLRIADVAKRRLEARRAQDTETFDVRFAETHYLNAAIATLPNDLGEIIAILDSYLDTLDLRSPTSIGTTGRVANETSRRMEHLSRKIRATEGFGKVGALQTAAVLRLLDQLDREDQSDQRAQAPVNLDAVD